MRQLLQLGQKRGGRRVGGAEKKKARDVVFKKRTRESKFEAGEVRDTRHRSTARRATARSILLPKAVSVCQSCHPAGALHKHFVTYIPTPHSFRSCCCSSAQAKTLASAAISPGEIVMHFP